jgi:ABC-type multidrug transport system ATPase subunit
MALLSCEGLGRRFGPRWVFRGVGLSLEPGQCLAVVGANGSGKSTLLKVLVGLIAPSEGDVTRPSRDEVGYAALDLSLYPQLTGAEHLALVGRFRGTAPAVDALAMVGLAGAEDKAVGVYSSGMRARLKLALALVASPPLLVLDEPTASLDDEGRGLVAQIVADQQARGAVLLATNDVTDRRWATHELALDG